METPPRMPRGYEDLFFDGPSMGRNGQTLKLHNWLHCQVKTVLVGVRMPYPDLIATHATAQDF